MGLGSNLGDREANLRVALELLAGCMALEKVSSLYDTEPWGYKDQPRFLNCVCQGRTVLHPQDLLAAIKDVEKALGREPTFPNGPRLIDVDILLYGQQLVQDPGLEIPHPRMAERTFVLVPLAEIAPDCLHPVLKLTAAELLGRVDGSQAGGAGLLEPVRLWAAPVHVPRLS